MAKIYNSELTRELTKGAKIQTSVDKIPNEIAEKVVPVMEVNPRLLRTITIVANADANDASSATIYTTPTNQDFYLVGGEITNYSSGAGNTANEIIYAYIGGAQRQVIRQNHPIAAVDVYSHTIVVMFPIPIKVDRNTAITVANSNNTATIRTSAIIYGYIEESSNA